MFEENILFWRREKEQKESENNENEKIFFIWNNIFVIDEVYDLKKYFIWCSFFSFFITISSFK